MNESISDGIFDSNEESILRAYAGLTVTNGGVNLNRSELPQAVTEAGTLSNTASISLNNVTYVANPDRNLPDHLICTVKKDDTASDSIRVMI